MEISIRRLSPIVLGLALLGTGAQADTRLGYGAPGGPAVQFLDVGQGAVRMSQAGQAQWMLYQDQGRTVFVVDDAERRFYRIDENMARDMGRKIEALQAQVEAQMAMLPPAQREMMRQMMPAMPKMGGAQYSVKVSDKTRKAGQWTCRDVTVLADGTPEEEICLASVADLKVPAADYTLMKRMGKTLGDLAASFGAGSMAAVLDQVDGLPVEHRKPGSQSPEAVLIEAGTATHPDGHFKMPEGYTEAPLIPDM